MTHNCNCILRLDSYTTSSIMDIVTSLSGFCIFMQDEVQLNSKWAKSHSKTWSACDRATVIEWDFGV